METIKKYLPYIAIILVVSLIGLGIAYINLNSERKALERANNALEDVFEAELQDKRKSIDSLQGVIESRNRTLRILRNAFIELDLQEETINQNSDEEIDDISNYDADSLEEYFSRRYN